MYTYATILGTSDTNHWEFICMQNVNLPRNVYLFIGKVRNEKAQKLFMEGEIPRTFPEIQYIKTY